MSEDRACEVPLVEQLRSIPEDYRTVRAIQWDEDGRETGHQFIPVGFMMHRAAAEIERLRAAAPEEPASEPTDLWIARWPGVRYECCMGERGAREIAQTWRNELGPQVVIECYQIWKPLDMNSATPKDDPTICKHCGKRGLPPGLALYGCTSCGKKPDEPLDMNSEPQSK